ncbi:hypothetical protein OCU04_010074 [Sclerotinia nivalis]|uniref:Uncharacterized protein n=1 Tax=Sclerotinia nivalis TaxID=352851 RepID=A0A9X0ADT9_9HELO|nr:hypothetical protein OCU04_010074 [Sclerotinia nivalis]
MASMTGYHDWPLWIIGLGVILTQTTHHGFWVPSPSGVAFLGGFWWWIDLLLLWREVLLRTREVNSVLQKGVLFDSEHIESDHRSSYMSCSLVYYSGYLSGLSPRYIPQSFI